MPEKLYFYYNADVPVGKVAAVIAILAFWCALAHAAADWLNEGGDPQHSGRQKREKILNAANVKDLKLIWKLRLDNQAKGAHSLTAPVILGHWITNRGTKELIFIAGSSDKVYAVDADLGRLFWSRRLESAPSPKPRCADGWPAAPALAPGPDVEDDDDDVQQAIRPVYVLSSAGRLHMLHPTTGTDISTPVQFVAPNPNVAGLFVEGGVVRTTASGGCGRPPTYWSQVTANGVVYKLKKGSPSAHAVLYAFDAVTGKQLYSSGDAITSFVRSSALALANGHICFGTEDNTLYCFGFPVDL